MLTQVRLGTRVPQLRNADRVLRDPDVASELRRRANAVATVIYEKLGQCGSRLVRGSGV